MPQKQVDVFPDILLRLLTMKSSIKTYMKEASINVKKAETTEETEKWHVSQRPGERQLREANPDSGKNRKKKFGLHNLAFSEKF